MKKSSKKKNRLDTKSLRVYLVLFLIILAAFIFHMVNTTSSTIDTKKIVTSGAPSVNTTSSSITPTKSVISSASVDYKTCTLNSDGYDVLWGCYLKDNSKVYINGLKYDSGQSDSDSKLIINAINTFCNNSIYTKDMVASNTGTDRFYRENNFARAQLGCEYKNKTSDGPWGIGFEFYLVKENGLWSVVDAEQQDPACEKVDGKGFPSYFFTCIVEDSNNKTVHRPVKA